MSDLQHSLSVEEVTVLLQEQHGLGDRLPTFADLPGLLRNESEQLELRQSRRSMRASIVNINLATSHEILRRLGDGCGVKMDRGYGTIVHPATADPLVPDLDQVQAINIGILDARRLPDDADTLQKLAKRFEAKADAQESDYGPSSASLARPTEPDATADGPAPPNLLIWEGKRHELPPRLWRLLNFMWNRDNAMLSKLEDEVWGNEGEVVKAKTVNAAVCKLNTELLAIGYPMSFSVKSGYITKT